MAIKGKRIETPLGDRWEVSVDENLAWLLLEPVVFESQYEADQFLNKLVLEMRNFYSQLRVTKHID